MSGYGCSPISRGCGRTFGSLSGFDAHHVTVHEDGSRHGSRCGCSEWFHRCLSDAELEALGMHRDPRGVWRRDVVGDGPMSRRSGAHAQPRTARKPTGGLRGAGRGFAGSTAALDDSERRETA